MKTIIIYAHPYEKSFNNAILNTAIKTLEENKKEYQVIDLNKDGFNPVLTKEELAVFNVGKVLDPLVIKYQKLLKEANELIFIFPIWWGTHPAIIKGFIDKVFLKNFAYKYGENGMQGLLTNINKALVLTTSQALTGYIKEGLGDPINNLFINGALKSVGVKNATWLNCQRTSTGSDELRKEYLKDVKKAL